MTKNKNKLKKTQQLMVHKTLQGILKIEQDELKTGIELSYTYGEKSYSVVELIYTHGEKS
jgi:hypothetical protein